MNVIFLDYDGVVNTPLWSADGKKCTFGYPFDNKVNNFQCVQWVSEFCEKYNYSIVVSSTWRLHSNYQECLQNGGLRKGIKIIGKTPHLQGKCRGDEITQWLDNYSGEVENYLIFDDDCDMDKHLDHLILCDTSRGFDELEFMKAKENTML